MARTRPFVPPPIEPRQFRTTDEIDRAIQKLQRRVEELRQLDIKQAVFNDTGGVVVAESNIREAIREVFGQNSPEFTEHQHITIWSGGGHVNMSPQEIAARKERGRNPTLGILEGLISRLKEKREDMGAGASIDPTSYFGRLNLHPRVGEVANDLFNDGHHWEAVFAAAKALVNYVKDRSGSDLDGANLMRTVFSRNGPILAFNALANATDLDEQEGMMHLFEGAALAIRNPGGHDFPEGPVQRAVEYLSLLSMLAYRVQEAKRSR